MPVREISYGVDGWGTGTIWFDGDTAVWHELPVGQTGDTESAAHPLVERIRAYLSLIHI